MHHSGSGAHLAQHQKAWAQRHPALLPAAHVIASWVAINPGVRRQCHNQQHDTSRRLPLWRCSLPLATLRALLLPPPDPAVIVVCWMEMGSIADVLEQRRGGNFSNHWQPRQ